MVAKRNERVAGMSCEGTDVAAVEGGGDASGSCCCSITRCRRWRAQANMAEAVMPQRRYELLDE